jgi:release factor glutamine methyltransferase
MYPSVFNPTDYYSSELFADFVLRLGRLDNKHILDLGCGSGIISIFAASIGAECIAADINPEAVKTTNENAELNGLEHKINVIESDLFGNINQSFDFIFFNPPYYPKEPKTAFEKAFNAGEDYRVIKEFASQVKNHLKQNAVIYMIISSDMDIEALKNIFINNSLSFNFAETHKRFFETFYIVKALKQL